MQTPHHREKLNFFQRSKPGRILRAMTLSDLSYWSMDAFISVVLILFVLQFIEGGSATHLGLAFLAYKAVAAICSVPVGRFFDRHKGHIDEMWGLAFSSLAAGSTYMLLSFSTDLWQLYAALVFLGFVSVVNLNSWRVLFYTNIERKEYSETVGVYQAIMSVGEGFALALGGFFGDTFGFDTVVFYGGLVIALGAIIPFSVKCFVLRK